MKVKVSFEADVKDAFTNKGGVSTAIKYAVAEGSGLHLAIPADATVEVVRVFEPGYYLRNGKPYRRYASGTWSHYEGNQWEWAWRTDETITEYGSNVVYLGPWPEGYEKAEHNA